MSECKINVYIGNVIHCSKPFTVEVLEKSFIAVNRNKIIAVANLSHLENFKKEHEKQLIDEVVLHEYQILIPGLIDTHNHACQYPNLGLGLNKPVRKWLRSHTFFLEQKFENLDFARKCYEAVVENTIKHGTTTAAYNATLHTDASLLLADIAISHGQRAFIGKVNTTKNFPVYGFETENTTIEETERFIKKLLNKKSNLVQPIITPRHVFRVGTDTLKKLTNFAKTYDLCIQTHMSECDDESKQAEEVYNKSFIEVLFEGGVLNDKTIVAHAIHLSNEEIQELAKYKTSVAHCPGSNFNLQSGICNVQALFKAGINVGLGTDISAGSNVGIVDQMRCAMMASNALYFNDNNSRPINCYDAFYMATLGGAKALSIEKIVGNFEVGKDFDALIVDMNVENGNSLCLFSYDPLELLQKFIYIGDDRNIISVFVAGRKVKC